jgi:hypothetical protein
MVKPAECRQMRAIMKVTASKMAKFLFWLVIICLGFLLLWRVSDLTLIYLSHQNFVKSNWMFFVIAGLCFLNTITSIFFFWCSWNADSAVTKDFDPCGIFISLGLVFILMPVVIGILLSIFANYFPGGHLPYGLHVAMKATFIYGAIIAILVVLIGSLGRVIEY